MVEIHHGLPDEALTELVNLYGEYEWWADRNPERVRRAVEHTDELVTITDDGDLVAAARVLTDYVYYATVFDVIVAEDSRGEGHGRRLMAAIVDHPDLQNLPGVSLLCREGLVEFYESCGFELSDAPVDHPDGEPEAVVRMKYVFEDRG